MSEDAPKKAKKAPAKFVNLQPSNVSVYDKKGATVIVCPYNTPHKPDGVYVVEGEHFRQFVSPKGPLYPFPKPAEGNKGVLAPRMQTPADAPKGTLLPPAQARAVQAAQTDADEDGEGSEGGDAAAGNGEGSGEGAEGAPESGEGQSEGPSADAPTGDDAGGEGEGSGDAEDQTPPADDDEPSDGDSEEADDAVTDDEKTEGAEDEVPTPDFKVIKNIGDDLDAAIKANGIASFDALANAPVETMVAIPGISDNNVGQIQGDAAVFAQGKNPYAKPAKKGGLKGKARKGK